MTPQRIGIDLGGTKIDAVLLAADGAVRERRRQPTPSSYRGTVTALVEVVGTLDAAAGEQPPVGIGTPGAWVPARRAMKNSNATWLNGQPLADDLRRALGERVRIANDANCLALSEAHGGAGQGAGVVFGVVLGTGVGGGLVVDGRVLAGANAIAGEWGHTPLPYFRADAATAEAERSLPDRPCYCGRSNCVETFLSGPGLAATHRALAGETLDATDVPPDAASWQLYTAMLARALAQIVNVLDPHVVVLGGGLSNRARLARDVASQIGRYAFAYEGSTRIERAAHGDASGVFGAAALWP